MKEIVFKNNEKIEVTNEYAEYIGKKILSGSANDFQVFYSDDKLQLIIRLSEIVFIRDAK